MSLPAQRQVQFDIPMDTDDESQYNGESGSPISNAAMGNTAFYFGIGVLPLRFNFAMDIPMSAVESTSPTMQQPLNLGFKLPIPASQQTPLPSSTPFNLGFQLPPASTPPQAALPAGPVQQPFNLGFQLTPSSTPPQTALPAGPVQQAFNLGFQLLIPINQPQAAAHSAPAFNLGFNAPIPATQTAAVESAAMVPAVQTTVQQAFNLGFQLPIPINQPQAAAHSALAFNLGFNAPIPATQTAAVESAAMVPAVQTPVQHVGYTTNNKSFRFNYEPLSPIGDWKLHPAFLWHPAFNMVDSHFPHSHASNTLPSSPTTLSDNLSISQTMPNCTNTSKTASLFILSSSPYHFQSSSAAYICQTIQTIIHSHLTFMITVDTMPFHPNAHQRLQTTKSLCR
ncbi:hypothetical protein EDB19DRAFT_2012277 [Suillus lakei]|nr:hypothetical protein EDB19DRAFT_2012277 [Suillus lakei]